MEADDNNERRRYFRIEDEVILFLREVQPEEMPDEAGFPEHAEDAFALTAKLNLLTCESRTQLRKIERESPEIGSFLRILEQKIDMVAHAILSRETELPDQPTRKVSLSASGLAFENQEAFRLGDTLELKMVLSPALVGIVAYGRVVDCRAADSDKTAYQVAVDFIGLREQDRELLIRHVVKRQMQQLRVRKQTSD